MCIKLLTIECPHCDAEFPISTVEFNQNIQIECPDCEATVLAKDCKVIAR